eukprot:TRINITY_DN514_c0_g1_i2.p3 TRINITY_DN514_c0_g1~~TRINITY_DN514_c0_g1_i2.p3  ORF type:complete len:104 (+),score=25.58 TRINITY_DN514_c0_g1_i2:736-1047(+)
MTLSWQPSKMPQILGSKIWELMFVFVMWVLQFKKRWSPTNVNIINKSNPVKCIENLNGHSIGRWKIHADNSVPIVKSNDTTKMKKKKYRLRGRSSETAKAHRG